MYLFCFLLWPVQLPYMLFVDADDETIRVISYFVWNSAIASRLSFKAWWAVLKYAMSYGYIEGAGDDRILIYSRVRVINRFKISTAAFGATLWSEESPCI